MYIKDSFIGTHRYHDFSALGKKKKSIAYDNNELWDSGITLLHKNAEIESVASIATLKKQSIDRFNKDRNGQNKL